MGIGAALGLGLVKGFTTAFQLEQQRRIKDEEKLDQLDIILANASVDPKAKGSQVAKLAETNFSLTRTSCSPARPREHRQTVRLHALDAG